MTERGKHIVLIHELLYRRSRRKLLIQYHNYCCSPLIQKDLDKHGYSPIGGNGDDKLGVIRFNPLWTTDPGNAAPLIPQHSYTFSWARNCTHVPVILFTSRRYDFNDHSGHDHFTHSTRSIDDVLRTI